MYVKKEDGGMGVVLRLPKKSPMLMLSASWKNHEPTVSRWIFHNFTKKQFHWLHPAMLNWVSIGLYRKLLYNCDNSARETTLATLIEKKTYYEIKKILSSILYKINSKKYEYREEANYKAICPGGGGGTVSKIFYRI